MGISIQSEGRRHYLIGDTYPIKDRLRSVGAKWDPERRAWWTGKRDVAESMAAQAPASAPASAPVERTEGCSTSEPLIRGRATYDGKAYYLLASGTSAAGRSYAKLAYRDGSKVFWAKDPERVQVVKRYQEPTSIEALQRFAERKRGLEQGKPGIRYECDECGERVTSGDGSKCWETGCAH